MLRPRFPRGDWSSRAPPILATRRSPPLHPQRLHFPCCWTGDFRLVLLQKSSPLIVVSRRVAHMHSHMLVPLSLCFSLQECNSFAEKQLSVFSSQGNAEGEYHMLVMRALSLWRQSSDACAPSATPAPDASAIAIADVQSLLKQALATAMRMATAEPNNAAAIRHAGTF